MSSARALAAATLLAGCHAALLAGCHTAPSTVRVSLSAAAGVGGDNLQLSVYDRHGRVIDGSNLGNVRQLPGDVVVMVSANAGEARVLAIALAGGLPIGSAAGRVPVLPGREMPLGLQLTLGELPDADRDGVPDVLDNCPYTFNPDQACSDGGDVGDACRLPGSDGGVLPGGGGDLGGLGDGDGGIVPAGCGNGVVDPGEQCDDGAKNSDDPAAAAGCTTMCRKRAACGSISGSAGARIDAATGHCYVAWPGPINFASAQHDCQMHGGYLAVITSAAENALVGTVGGSTSMWIGLEVTHGATDSFHWVDGEPYAYSAFQPGQPDNGGTNGPKPEDCIARTATGWDDVPCGFPSTGMLPPSTSFALGFVCESSCGNGVVDPGEECDGGPSCTANCYTRRPCTEPGGYSSPVSGHCYFTAGVSVDQGTALASSCPSGTHLATLPDLSETNAGLLAMGAATDAWIALKASTTVGVFAWELPATEALDSSRYHGFAGIEPNDTVVPSCVRLHTGVGWDDKACSTLFDALCER